MDKPRKKNLYNFVGAFSDISVNDSLISSNALQHKSSISSFSFKCEDEQETDKKRMEINGIGGRSMEVHDVKIQSDNWCLCSVSEEVKVTNCCSKRVCVIKQKIPGYYSEQDPLFINEGDLSRKIILERNDSTSPFYSKIKKEKPDNDLNQDPLLVTEQDYINFAKNEGKDMKIKVEDVSKITLHLKDLRVVLERMDTNFFLPSLVEKENTDLRKELDAKNKEIRELKQDLCDKTDQLEQYTRRNSLRIFGIPENDKEDTDQLAISVAQKLSIQCALTDIDRSHRVGKKIPGKCRPIIVKFVSYRKRREMFQAKRGLKRTGITVREDLTRTRLELLQAAIARFGLDHTWTEDGTVIVKKGNSRLRLQTFADLDSIK